MVRSLRTVVAFAIAVATMAAGAAPAAAAPGGGTVTPTGPAGPPGTVHTVTLLTGDVVRLTTFPDGRQEVDVEQAPGRVGYQLSRHDGDVHVTPYDALPLVAAGRLDRRLFNITQLVADGYHDAARSTLPLLVTGDTTTPGVRAAAPRTPAGATRRRELPSIGGVALHEEKSRARDFWASVAGTPTGGPRTLAAGIGRIWLDRRLHADLTESVPRIGAPKAWRAGYDGTGVTVAVLDSGYDPTHPDLAGKVKAAASFTGTPDTTDRVGHGTHVAATIAGRGTAGQPGGRGVAPGAQLLIGKVLGDNGSGDLSWTIAGMEWAVQQGADVVNLSLGAPAGEGPDPVTEALDALSASSGTLFVVSAGNSGPGRQTLNTPGTADRALTVGAVDDANRIADFSSRGPRLGDGAVKPEVTAPGVGIVAARAAGTTLGEVVDANYTAMSGTSMAAPHVAGAAALLAQRHPDWTAEQLKAALVSSADEARDVPVEVEGAGRIDVAAALDQQVVPDTATVAFGQLAAGTPARTATVHYTNHTKRPVTLRLDAEARDIGTTGARAALTVSPQRLTIPPGGRASAVVRLDTAATAPGRYVGLLTANGGGERLRTPIGFEVTPPIRTVTIEAVDRDGGAPADFFSRVQLWNLDTDQLYWAYLFNGQPGSVDLPAGRYSVTAWVMTVDASSWPKDATLLTEPELTIDRDRKLRFDARTATEIRVDTPHPTEARAVYLGWQRSTAAGTLLTTESVNPDMVRRVYAAPSRKVTTGDYRFFSRWDRAAPWLTATVTGGGGFTVPDLVPVEGAPLFDGTATVPLVDGGTGTPTELAAAGARGAVVLLPIKYDADGTPGREQLRAAAEAGARAVLFHGPTPGYYWADGFAAAVPAYVVDAEVAQRLRDRLATGPVGLTLHGVSRSPYHYDLLLPERRAVPADLHYTVSELRLATVETEFHQHAPQIVAREGRSGYLAGVDLGMISTRALTAGQRRTDYVSTRDVSWRGSVVGEAYDLGNQQGRMYGPMRAYRAGERVREVWFPALTRPAVPVGVTPDYGYGLPVNRAHDAIRVAIPQYANGDATAYGWVDNSSDRSTLTLRRGDTVIGQTNASNAQFTVPGGRDWYQLSLDVVRDRFAERTWWTTSTATSTTWTFRSERPRGDKPVVLPLPQLDYAIDADLTNAVRADRPYQLVLRPGYQPGAKGPGRFSVTVAVSYDDGAHWTTVATRDRRGEVTATVPAAPAGAEFATVRVTAQDRDGNRIEQTITRAWRVTR